MSKNISLKKYEIVNLDYRTILPLQEDLKELDNEDENKFLESLKENGKFLPEVVWWCSADKCWYTMDGHARLKTYAKHGLTFDGGYMVDFLSVQATDRQDAAQKILLISSEYHKITTEGLINFSEKFDLNIDKVSSMVSLSGFGDLSFIGETKRLKKSIEAFSFIPVEEENEEETWEEEDKANENPNDPDYEPFDISDFVGQSKSEDNTEGYLSDENEPIKPLTEGNKKQSAGNEFASINEIVSIDTKAQFNEIISEILEIRGVPDRNSAIQYLIETYYRYGDLE